MTAPERSILEIMQAAGQEPPRVQLPPAVAEGGDGGNGSAVGRAGRYEVIGPLAEGGVGEVLRGRDLDLGRDVALKVLREKHAANPELVQRLLDEAQIGGQLQHPGIVPVYEIGVDEKRRPFLAMKLVKGKTLAARLAERASPSEGRRRFLRLFEQLAEAVAYAHARGVVHRDLKPSNVMVGSFGEVQVLDWGFAKVLRRGGLADEHRANSREADVTRIATVRSAGSESVAGSVMGTPAYMPPEQALGEIDQLDERCDVFALGAILCEMLTGKPPYVGDRADLLTLAAQARLDDAHERLDGSGADAALVALCRECLEPLRGDRPRDASVVAERVHDYLASVEERARAARITAAEARAASEKAEAEAERQRRGRRLTLLVGAGVLALLVAGIGGAWVVRADERAQATRTSNAVVAAMQDAERLRGEGRLAEAEAAARRAGAVAQEGEAASELGASVEVLVAAIQQQRTEADALLAQQVKDQEMVRRLREIEATEDDQTIASTRSDQQDARLAEAFRAHGLDVEAMEPEAAGAALRASGIHLELLRALESWVFYRRAVTGSPESDWTHLAAVADAADPDPWAVKMRRAALERDAEALRRAAKDGAALEARPERAVALASWLSGAGEVERALELVDALLVRHPDDRRAHGIAQGLAAKLNKPELVRRHAVVSLALEPASRAAYDGVSIAHQALGDDEAAIAWSERALSVDPESLDAVSRLVALHQSASAGSLDPALADWQRRLEEEADSPQLLALAGFAHAQKREPKEAMPLFERLVALRPDSADALGFLSVACLGLGDHERGFELLAQAVRLEPGNTSRAWSLGVRVALFPFGSGSSHAEAVARFETLLPEASALARYQFLLGYAYRRAGQKLDDALAACREASSLLPEAAWPHHFMSSFLGLGTTDHAQAHAEAARAVELDPWTAMFRYQLGIAAYQAGEVDEALVELGEAVKRSADFGQAHLAWIWVLALQGRVEDAVAHYEARVEEEPSGSDRILLGIALLRAGRPEDAAEILAGVWREDPNLVGAATWLAIAYYRTGRAEEAVPVLEDAARRRPTAALNGAYSLLADLHLLRGEPERARAVYLEALRQGGTSTGYNERHVAFAAACCGAPEAAQAWCEQNFPSMGAYAPCHIQCGIGEALFARGDLPAALTHVEDALKLVPRYAFLRALLAKAHLVRGDLVGVRRVLPQPLLLRAGLKRFVDWEEARFVEVVAEIEAVRGSEINLAQGLGLEDRVAQLRSNMTRSERLAAWAKRLDTLHEHADAIRAGTWEADSARAALDAAEFARCSGAYAQATKYFLQAFESYLREFRWEGFRVRFRAARAAVRAAAGEGVDAETRRSLHASARAWLQDELEEWRIVLAERPPRGRSGVSVLDPELWHWKHHLDLESVWSPDALAKLPDAEREAWEALWAAVDEVLATQR